MLSETKWMEWMNVNAYENIALTLRKLIHRLCAKYLCDFLIFVIVYWSVLIIFPGMLSDGIVFINWLWDMEMRGISNDSIVNYDEKRNWFVWNIHRFTRTIGKIWILVGRHRKSKRTTNSWHLNTFHFLRPVCVC